MENRIQKNIYKVTLLLLLAFCLGGANKLYATQNDEVDEKKEDMPDTAQDTSPNDADNQATNKAAAIIDWKADWKIDWSCKSIQSCKAAITIMGCLECWSNLNRTRQIKDIYKYLSSSNNYKDIVNAYHHLLDRHLSSQKNKETYTYINQTLKNRIKCDFASCKAYTRNQRPRGKEDPKADEQDDDKEYLFLQDFLDTIHAYLVHGSDSGHRYSPSSHNKHYKVHKRPMADSSDGEKELDMESASYTLFDEEMAALREWQKSIQKKGINQTKNKFSTTVATIKQNDEAISFELLASHFKNNPTFALWLQYLRDNACDTDVLLHTIHDDTEDNILSSGFKGDKKIVADIAHFIHQAENAKQATEKNKKTASYGFGVRLYYWDWYKNEEDKDWRSPPYRYCDLYVAPTYPSFKNEMLAKKHIFISKWNQKMYAAKLMLASSATLRKLKADDTWYPKIYGIQEGAGLSIWHLLSIVFYTNFTALCTSFGESLRYISPAESLQKLVQRNSKWYYLSRYLREVVEVFGTRIDGGDVKDAETGEWVYDPYKIKGDTYYHGVSYLLFTQFSVHWYGPLSTSKQMEVATLFTTSIDNGLLLELKEDNGQLSFFNVSLLSCFGSEDERLFIGGLVPIQIATIRLLQDNINLQQIMHALFMVHSMIRGKKPGNKDKALSTDTAIYKDLGADPNKLPFYAQQIWYAFRQQQQRIKMDIRYMHQYYKVFIPLLIDVNCKNLLLLDKMVQLFPNVTEIICVATDCIDDKISQRRYWKEQYSYSIVSSDFMLRLKDRLSKIDNQAKLTKIVIQTEMRFIKDSCKLYPTQFGTLGWKIGKGRNGKTIVVTKEAYDVIYKDVISQISAMIQAKYLSSDVTSLDVRIFNELILGAKDIPADAQKQWDVFRNQQQDFTINMDYMYRYYREFMPLLFDPKIRNLLLLDKIAQLFPNVIEIICKETDCDGVKYKGGVWRGEYSSAVVSANFILGLKERLSKMEKQAKLTKIVIQTKERFIADSCNLYAPQFGDLGWKIGKGCDSKAIVVTKEPYDVMYKDMIPKISDMIQGKKPSDDSPHSLDVSIFNQLIDGAKDVPADVQKEWNALRHQEQRITIDMECMYNYYKAFMPLLIDINCKNLLLLDKMVQLFPNVTEIICAATDCIKGGEHSWERDYSSAIVCSNFILGAKDRLSTIDKHTKLTKIVIQTSQYRDGVKDDCKLYATKFEVLGWQIGKGCNGKTIVLTKEPYDGMYKDVIPKIKSMIEGAELSDDVPPVLDVPIFKKLIARDKDIPAGMQKQWDTFRHQPQSITIDMSNMYEYYKAFMPLLFDTNCKNLLLLDKMVQLFPNVTEIIWKEADCIKGGEYSADRAYSADIVCSNFMLGLKEQLSKIDKGAKLTKIVIQIEKRLIKDSCNLYPTQFGALGWQVQRELYYNRGYRVPQKNNQITLNKAPHGNIWEAIIKEGVIPCIASLIAGKTPDDSKLTSASCMPVFNQLILRDKYLPADVQKEWDTFRHQQQRITIDIENMYGYFQAFMPLVFDPKCKNLLLLDKIAQLFPNVTEIICRQIDGDMETRKYSSAIVCSNFMLGVKDRLSNLGRQAKLTKVVIQTYKYKVKNDCNLYAPQFGALGWQIGRGGKTIVVTKEPYEVRCKDVIAKIKSMLQREYLENGEATSLEVPIFNKLINGEKEIPADVQKQWNTFRHQQQRITIDMWEMYTSYKAFMPLLCDPKIKNLLLLDKIVQLFPNVTEIICKKTDCVGIKDNGFEGKCSADIVCSNFILGVKERLCKMGKQAKLTKIVIKTSKYEIKDDCNLYPIQFESLGWQVQKGSYKNDGWRAVQKNNQITLTRLKEPNTSLSNDPPALLEANENKPNNHQLADNEVFDLD